MICCPNDATHRNWWGARFCGACGTRLLEKKSYCAHCGWEKLEGNDLGSFDCAYCTACGKQEFKITVSQAEGHFNMDCASDLSGNQQKPLAKSHSK